MTDHREIDWAQERPSDRNLTVGWLGARVQPVDELDDRISAIVEAFEVTHTNGGALAAQFSLDVDVDTKWFLSRNRLAEIGFFRQFFNHEAVKHRLMVGELLPNGEGNLGFEKESPFVAMGRLGAALSQGGAYSSLVGQDAKVVDLMQGFSQAAFDGRYSEVRSYVSWKPWSRWFMDVAWDGSWFWLDHRTGIVTVLMVTDTD